MSSWFSFLLLSHHSNFFIREGAAFAPTESRARSLSALMSSVQSVHAREILDSRGNPTVEVRVKHLHFIGGKFKFLIDVFCLDGRIVVGRGQD